MTDSLIHVTCESPVGSFQMLLPGGHDMTKTLQGSGIWEISLGTEIFNRLSTGDSFVDVGAQLRYYTRDMLGHILCTPMEERHAQRPA